MTCKIIFVQFGQHKNFLDKDLLDEKMWFYVIKLDTVFTQIAQSGRRCSYESNWPGCYNTSATQRVGKVLQYTYSGNYSIT